MNILGPERRLDQRGFTLLELVMVIVIIGFLAAAGAQRFIDLSEDVEITAEDSTVEILRNNLVTNFGNDLVKGRRAIFPTNPFSNLNKVPDGYDRRRANRPSGNPSDDGIWMFIAGGATANITPEQAGTTVLTFNTTGFVFHQRRDHTIVKWAYDATNGIISQKILEQESSLKLELDAQKRLRGEITEKDRLFLKQRRRAAGGT